jgi:hypothetical protein
MPPYPSSGADVNAQSKQHGNTALILAASRLHKEVTERLLLAGADVNAATKVHLARLGRDSFLSRCVLSRSDCVHSLEIHR